VNGGALSEDKTFTVSPSPVGLGGWLVLVGIGLFVAPISLAMFLLTTFTPSFQDGTWEALTSPDGWAYHPLWAPLLIFEMVGNGVFILLGLYLLVLYFGRRSRFPKLYIACVFANLVFIFVDAWLGSFVLPDEPMFDVETAGEIGKSLIAAAIWVPYMRVSKRVRNTFVNPIGDHQAACTTHAHSSS
jgi:hypothetical protein